MNFLNDIKSSLYNPVFYASLRGRTLGSSFKYFFFLVSVLAFVMAFAWGSQLAPLFSGENLKKIVNYYPEELTVTIKGGVISTNVTEPYIIKAGEELSKKSNSHKNVVVIDTKNDFSRELFEQYDASVWVGRDFVVSAKSQGRTELSDVRQVPDFSLNQERLLHWVDVIDSYHLLLSLGLFVVLFLSFYGLFISQLIWLIIVALFVLLIGKLYKKPLSYRSSYQTALHAATVPFVLMALSIVSGINAPFIFFYSLVALMIVTLNFQKGGSVSSDAPAV
ncbi:MAG: DUF1189 family protein [bacterium]|nr:DUF1189 family protein [bacterium]